jgi:hypothetical protein
LLAAVEQAMADVTTPTTLVEVVIAISASKT